jgi:ankyrin repeat protein
MRIRVTSLFTMVAALGFLGLGGCYNPFGEDRDRANPQIVSQAPTSVKYPGYRAPELFEAILRDDADKVWSLIQEGADVNAKTEKGVTPLMAAVENNKRNIVRLLLGAGADIESKNDKGQTALMLASMRGADEFESLYRPGDIAAPRISPASLRPADTVRLLLEGGAKSDTPDDFGATALMYASDAKKIALLLRHGAKIDAQDKNGRTALMAAALECNIAATQALLENGAHKDIVDNMGKTARALIVELQQKAEQETARPATLKRIEAQLAWGGKLRCIKEKGLLALLS